MNKKFSTLLCAGLLVSAFTLNAQTPAQAQHIDALTSISGVGAAAVPYFESATPKGMFQLKANDKVLIVENDKYKLVAPSDLTDVESSLWCISITETESQGKNPIFDFINKKTGAILAFDTETSNVGSSFGGWAFSSTWTKSSYEKDPTKGGLRPDKELFTYIDSDYAYILFDEGDEVKAKKVMASDAEDKTGDAQGALKFTVWNAGTYVLSANEINAYLKNNKDVLNFHLDANADVNPFSASQIEAKVADGVTADGKNFVYVVKKDEKDKKTYLKVDTAANGVGIEFLKFGWSDTNVEKYADALTVTGDADDISQQHKFLFTYRPSADSLFIQVKEARVRDTQKPTAERGYWKDATKVKYGSNYHDIYCDGKQAADANSDADQLFVKLQNYTVADRIVTIGTKAINTQISFGINGCVASNNKTSLDEGLYIIKNDKGQVLAAPIHLNDNNAANEAQWITLDEQDPMHMPAYQWVVTKVYTADKAKATSPVKFVNREFPELYANSVQLTLNEDGDIIGTAVGTTIDKVLNKATFTRITDKNILGDKKLGYRYIPTDSLLVNKYVFNYLNPFTDSYWMANGADKDSVNYVKETASRYMLEEGSTAGYGYGYGKDKDTPEGKALARLGIARLERTNYVVKTVDGAKSLVEAYGEKYSMGVNNYKVTPYVVDTFFFKENNHYNAKHFYAIVESAPKWVASDGKVIYAYEVKNDKGEVVKYVDAQGQDVSVSNYKWAGAIIQSVSAEFDKATHKVGTADDGKSAVLKVQILNETRTSAFTVEADKTPLYRRFNNAVIGEKADDAADSLIFVEKIRQEYLMDEWNPNLTSETVDYAGIWNRDKAKGKLVFNIDTAWVNRGKGYIKPQYLISVDRQDQDLNIVTHPCTEAGPHIKPDGTPTTDPYECVHATHKTLGFTYGKYLVSFGDSAMVNDMEAPYMDIKGGYTRVGFVRAIKVGDSLVVLTNGFEKVEPAKIDTAEIFANYKATKCERFIVDLTGDNHKNVTWSFRYVNPLEAAKAYIEGGEGEGVNNEFLFESNIYEKTGYKSTNATVAGVSTDGKATKGFQEAQSGSIAPEYAAWLKMQNGCLVLTRGDSKFDAAKTGSDGALIFNAVRPTEKDDMVTSNDEVSVEGVSVVATNGAVTIQGAAGKSVVITNILGKVVAETILTSDNATIAVPAGIVAVAVDGEEAVKVVVK